MTFKFFNNLVIIILFANPILSQDYLMPKLTNPIEDATSIYTNFNDIKNWKEFQVNLSKHLLEIIENAGLLFGISTIGNYGSEYNFRKRLALILLQNPKDYALFPFSDRWFRWQTSLNLLDKKIEWNVFRENAESPLEFQKRLKEIDVQINYIILGTVIDAKKDSEDKSYNMIYHTWAGLWHRKNQLMEYFNEKIKLGIFENHGLKTDLINDIGLFRFLPVDLSWHDPQAISPNNARIRINPKQQFSSFQIVAISQDKQHLNYSVFLLANTNKSEGFLADILNNSNNILELGKNLIKALTINKEKFNSDDLNAIKLWIYGLARQLKIEFSAFDTPILEDKINDFYQLALQLQNLKLFVLLLESNKQKLLDK